MYKWKPTSRNIWLFYNRKVSCIVPYTLFFQPKSNQMLGLWIICGNKILPHFYSGHVYDYWGSKTADPCVIWVVGVYTYRVASYKCFFGMQIFHHIKCSPLEFKISILCRVYGEIWVIQFTSSILLLKWMHVLLYNHYWKMTKCLYIRIWNIQGAWLTGGKRAWLTGGKKNDMSATHFSA